MINREQDIIQWAKDRNILKEATAESQALKTLEEVKELISAKSDGEAKDAIGDAIVTLVIGAAMRGTSIGECTELAWQEIKDRKGVMVHGFFVKESTLESLKHGSVYFDEATSRFESICNTMTERDQAVASLNSCGFKCDSEYQRELHQWVVFSIGLHDQ